MIPEMKGEGMNYLTHTAAIFIAFMLGGMFVCSVCKVGTCAKHTTKKRGEK